MSEKSPRFIVDKVREQKETEPQPYDAIFYREPVREKVGFVRDNFCVEVSEKGKIEKKIRFPTSITYFKKNNGDWHKELFGYTESIDVALENTEMNYFVVYDPSSELSFLAMPFDSNSEILRAKDNLIKFLENAREQNKESLQKLVNEFAGIQFGLFGSRSIIELGISKPISDIDLVIYGPANYEKVIKEIERNEQLRIKSNLTLQSDTVIESNIEHYMKKYFFSELEARIMATRRRRYKIYPNIKLSLNCAIERQGKNVPMTIGSKKVQEITVEGVVTDSSRASALPRVVTLEVDKKEIDVITREWSLKDFIRAGDKVKVSGALRESQDNIEFISLENMSKHIIKPVA